MTYAEKKALCEAAKAVDMLNARVDALIELTELLLSRKAGRPTKAETDQIEALRLRAYG